MTLLEILAMTVEELKGKCNELGLDDGGGKTVLQERVIRHFGFGERMEGANSEYGEAASGIQQPGNAEYCGSSTFTLKDIEDSLSRFSGEGTPEIDTWIEDFESCAVTVKWNELQKYIYGRRLLSGAARIFCRSQSNIRNWSTLKAALKAEFGKIYSSIEVHQILNSRKKRPNESLREYLYCLQEIGSTISIDDASIIEYFIQGIADSKANKLILYQAADIADLKLKMKVYEKVAKPSPPLNFNGPRNKEEPPTGAYKKDEKQMTCYNCGKRGHISRDCATALPKCFKCNEIGHKSFECKVKHEPRERKSTNYMRTLSSPLNSSQQGKIVSQPNRIFKDLTILGVEISAFLDTGSDISCVRYDTLMAMQDVNVSAERKRMVGIGEKEIETIGAFETMIDLDGVTVPIKFHVARERDILFAAVLGNDIFQHVSVVIEGEEAKFVKRSSDQNLGLTVERTMTKSAQEDYDEVIRQFGEICFAVENPDVEVDHLSRDVQRKILKLVNDYHPSKPKTFPVKMRILLKDEIPVFHRPRRMSSVDQQAVDKQVLEWLKEGIVKHSHSEYSSPVVLVSKKDGTKRLCCDYRRLNEKIIRDNFPMVVMDDVMQRLQEAKIYTTLDLRNGFFHVPIEYSSQRYTSFVTHRGQFEFLYVPFGLSNSPAVFCRYITAIFHELIADGTVVLYMDDMVIPSQTEEEGLQKLGKVLKVASLNGLKIKWNKCQFLMKRITFLGYVLENSTILPSKEKTAAVENFPVPKDQKAVQRFLGLTSYFRRFIRGYALIAKPLSDLLKKDTLFKMGDEQILAVQQLKAALVGASVLRLFNPKAESEIHTDASKHGYGAVLLQKDSEDGQLHPIEYMSRKTTAFEEKYHSYELEVLAVVESLKKWRVYVMGLKVKIVTDCNAFTMTMRKQDVPLRISRWALFLQDFEYTIEHRSGSMMRHVDALSRVCCLMLEDSLRHKIKKAQLEDDWIRAVSKVLESDRYEDFFMKYGLLHKDPAKELVVIPSNMEKEVIEMAHKQGHFGARKTADLVEKNFYIRRLNSKTESIVKSCVECIMSEAKAGRKEGLLDPIDKSDKPLMTYHLDHIGPMETTKKQYNHILVIVDAFSKFVWLYPTRSTGTGEVIDRLRKQSVIFGNPARIITDRGSAFTSKEFSTYCADEGVQHLLIATGVPRGNGQVERIHRIIVPLLTKLCHEKQQNWYRYVDMVQKTINNSPPRSTGATPFEIMTGLKMRVKEDADIRKLLEDAAVSELHQERDSLREKARKNILRIQQENKRSFDRKRVPAREYVVNDLVAIKRTQFGAGLKLRPKFLGPYKVIKRANHGRYEVEKLGEGEGSRKCTTVAEYMKPWNPTFEANVRSGGPNVGMHPQRLRRSDRLQGKRQ